MFKYTRSILLFRSCFGIVIITILGSCSLSHKISKDAGAMVVNTKALEAAHVGISIFEPATGKYWFNYQGDKYFVPASNTKLPTCYAAMKYLGDSIAGLRYSIEGNQVLIQSTGDPTFLQEDFKRQPVLDFLKSQTISTRDLYYVSNPKNSIAQWGSGWGWSDYDADYMAERNEFPVYGNIITITHEPNSKSLATGTNVFDRLLNGQLANARTDISSGRFAIVRKLDSNDFEFKATNNKFSPTRITFVTNGPTVTLDVLKDLLQKSIQKSAVDNARWQTIYSQSTDSLLRITMHRSDNFFAEQSLLMVSDKLLGYMDDDRIIDTLLKTDFKDLPQKPRWVDGCGLSRYNLFSPQDFVSILGKMKTDFGMNRVKNILATGGEGTISSYYRKDSGYIYAKTGTLAGVVALSGFLETKDHKQLIFSVLVNNHRSSATDVRRAVEQFLESVRNKY